MPMTATQCVPGASPQQYGHVRSCQRAIGCRVNNGCDELSKSAALKSGSREWTEIRTQLNHPQVSVFTESINGADGIAFDDSGILCRSPQIERTRSSGTERGGTRGGEDRRLRQDRRDGAPEGLLSPASLVLVGREVYITNLGLPLTPAVGDEPEEDVTRSTMSRFRLLPNRRQ